MAGLTSAIGKALNGKRVRKAGGDPVTVAKFGKNGKEARDYAQNPTDKKFLGVDPKKFGYPAEKTVKSIKDVPASSIRKSRIAVGNPKKVR